MCRLLTLVGAAVFGLSGLGSISLAAPPTAPGLVEVPKSKAWQHRASGFVFPEWVGGFERQIASASATRPDEVLVTYRLTTRMGDSFQGYTNVTITVFGAEGRSLPQAFKARCDGANRFRLHDAKLLKSGETPGPPPGFQAQYAVPARNLAGHNEDGFEEITVFKFGEHFVECSGSFADDRADTGFKALADFKKKLQLGR